MVGIVEPVDETAPLLKNCTSDEVSVVELEIVKAIVATTPFAIVLVFIPDTTQVETPDVLLQLIDFPAAVVAAPVETLNALKSFVAYVMLHWTPEGCVTVELNDKLKLTTLPGLPEPDERLRETL